MIIQLNINIIITNTYSYIFPVTVVNLQNLEKLNKIKHDCIKLLRAREEINYEYILHLISIFLEKTFKDIFYNVIIMEFKCEQCSIVYKSNSGLWKHNLKHHKPVVTETPNENTSSVTEEKKKFLCRKCDKPLSDRNSRWRHEKTCKNVSINSINEKVKYLEKTIDELKAKPNIVNNYTTNNTLNERKVVIHSSPGSESIDHLSVEQQRAIMNKGLQSLMYLIKTTNFNKEMPENHSYCVTALNDKHASVIDITTNSIIKTDKTELFDKVLIGNIKKLEKMAENKNFGNNEREVYRLRLEDLKNILFRTKRGTKVYYNELNLLSYNNKELVYDTWASLKSLDEIINSEENHKNIICDSFNNEIEYKQPIKRTINDYADSNSELSDDSDFESDSESEVDEVTIKGKTYIIDDKYAFIKTTQGTKGEVYGKYINGKIIKLHKEKHIDV